MSKDTYESPLNSRYASREMQYIFSPDKKFRTWRLLWIALAEAERNWALTSPMSRSQISKLIRMISIMRMRQQRRRSAVTM